jgi:hypothetical protein
MTIREPERVKINGVAYRIETEIVERIEFVERHTQLPDPSLKVERALNLKPVMDGLNVTLEEKAEYADNDGKRFERLVKEDLVGRNLLSRNDYATILIHALQADSARKSLEDLR